MVLWSKQPLAAHPTPVLSSARLPLVVTGTLPGARRHSTITNLTCNFRRLTSGCNRFLWFHGQARRSETPHPAVPSGADLFTSPLIPPTLTDRNAKRRHPQRSAFGAKGKSAGPQSPLTRSNLTPADIARLSLLRCEKALPVRWSHPLRCLLQA